MQTRRSGIASQHRQLDGFLSATAEALRGEDRRVAENAVFRLQGALHAHFDVEEQVVFPGLLAARPETRPSIEALVNEHVELRERLAEIAASLATTPAGAVARALQEFREALCQHERIEESLLDPPDLEEGAPA